MATDLVDWCLISELSNELVSLDVDVLFAWGCFRRLNIAGEEFFRSLRTLLLQSLRIILPLVGLEELVRVGPSWDDHRCVSTSTEDSFVVGDVLREVGLVVDLTIRVLILLLLGDNARMGSEAFSTSCTV